MDKHHKRTLLTIAALIAMLALSITTVSAQGPTPQPVAADHYTVCPRPFEIRNGCVCSQPETRANVIATFEWLQKEENTKAVAEKRPAKTISMPPGWEPGKSVWLISGKIWPATIAQPAGQSPTKASASATPTLSPTVVRASNANATPVNPTFTPVPRTFSTRGDPTSSTPDQGPPMGLIIGGSLVFGLAGAALVYFVVLPRLKKTE